MRLIYEPSGRAKEYADLALNISTTCPHKCRYCYVPSVMKKDKEVFHDREKWTVRKGEMQFIKELKRDAEDLDGDDREILLCFTCDPYPIQIGEEAWNFTRKVIRILRDNDLRFTLLTKAGEIAVRDFDLLRGYDKCSIGTTMFLYYDNDREYWEPNASSLMSRIKMLSVAKRLEIPTWVSVEPVIYPKQAIDMVHTIHNEVDFFKIGKLNCHRKDHEEISKLESSVNWPQFRSQIMSKLAEKGFTRRDKIVSSKDEPKGYYIKKDLREQ